MSKYVRFISTMLVALFAMLSPVALVAQQAPQANPLTVSFANLTLAKDSVRARTQASTSVMPGDTLRYSLTFTNRESRALANVVFNNPVPSGVVVMPAPAPAGIRVEYSIDGGFAFSARPMVLVEENGRQVSRPAEPESYTHIRWTVADSIAPGARVTAQYDVRVTGRTAPARR
jgi:uncharacterized repeat protein (TIGR01451 family)